MPDPLIYRFCEQVYGTTWKELIQEEFGDGSYPPIAPSVLT
jgi:cyanate lyase